MPKKKHKKIQTEEKQAEAQPKPDETQKLKEENAALKDQLLRAMAEAENTRKRAQREIEDTAKYAVGNFARDLIEVLENLHRAEESIPQDHVQGNDLLKNINEGVKLTKAELLKVFDRYGIKRISPMGEKFDHNFHQAVVQIEDASVEPGQIVQVIQAGYVIKDRLLRPAMVAVAKTPATPNPEETKPT